MRSTSNNAHASIATSWTVSLLIVERCQRYEDKKGQPDTRDANWLILLRTSHSRHVNLRSFFKASRATWCPCCVKQTCRIHTSMHLHLELGFCGAECTWEHQPLLPQGYPNVTLSKEFKYQVHIPSINDMVQQIKVCLTAWATFHSGSWLVDHTCAIEVHPCGRTPVPRMPSKDKPLKEVDEQSDKRTESWEHAEWVSWSSEWRQLINNVARGNRVINNKPHHSKQTPWPRYTVFIHNFNIILGQCSNF